MLITVGQHPSTKVCVCFLINKKILHSHNNQSKLKSILFCFHHSKFSKQYGMLIY